MENKKTNNFEILKELLQNNIRQYGMMLALVGMMIFFAILTKGISLVPLNITNLILQNGYILILAVGMLMVILTGNIDLSVGSIAALVGAMAGVLMIQHDVNWVTATLIAVLIGVLAGAWNGFWIAYMNIPAFIVTLGGMLIFRGLTLVILKGISLGPFPDQFNKISSGFIPDYINFQQVAGESSLHTFTVFLGIISSLFYIFMVIRKRRQMKSYGFELTPAWIVIFTTVFIVLILNAFTFTLARYRGLPNVSIVLIITIIIYAFISNQTIFGRHIYAMGGNYEAAKLSGIKTKKNMFLIYVNMGLLSAVSGLVYAARLNAATPKAGNLFELDAIAAAYIGGASATGGVGTVVGAIIGGLVMGVINNGMSLMGLGIDWQQVVKGLVLVAAVLFDILTKNKAK